MTSYLSTPARQIQRAQPWLGTLVSIFVDGVSEQEANNILDSAFEEVARVHQLMSFHSHASDVSRLNRAAPNEIVQVHPYTTEVLQCAQRVSGASNGSFDVTVGAELVSWGLLPDLETNAYVCGGWWDIELLPDNCVRLHRPLCIDLGGIAKGYAVDKAIDSLRRAGASNAVVNAGGDIRVLGSTPEFIRLAATYEGEPAVLELSEGSVASSSSNRTRAKQFNGFGPHFDGRTRSQCPPGRFVTVVAQDCIVADALTKVVLADGVRSANTLGRLHAFGFLYDPGEGWRGINTETGLR